MITRVLGFAALVGVCVATSCGSWLTARAPLIPAPAFDCLTSTLSASPDVARMHKPYDSHGRQGVNVDLRDASAKPLGALITRHSRGVGHDTVYLSIELDGRKAPAEAELQRAGALAVRVLEQLRSTCAPEAPRQVECMFGYDLRPCAA